MRTPALLLAILLGLPLAAAQASDPERYDSTLRCTGVPFSDPPAYQCEQSATTRHEHNRTLQPDETLQRVNLTWAEAPGTGAPKLRLTAIPLLTNATLGAALTLEGDSPIHLPLPSDLPVARWTIRIGPTAQNARPLVAQPYNLTLHLARTAPTLPPTEPPNPYHQPPQPQPRPTPPDPAPLRAAATPQDPGARIWEAWVALLLLGLLAVSHARRQPLWALFARLLPARLLDHPRRRALLQLIQERPGLRAREAQRALGLDNGPFEHHARKLEAAGRLRVHRTPHGAYLFPPGTSSTAPPTASERIQGHVRANPGANPSRIARALRLAPALVRYHVLRLARQGALALRKTGREARCYAAP